MLGGDRVQALPRRTVLWGAGVGAAAAALAGCAPAAPGGGGQPGGDRDAAVELPTFTPYEGLTPDLPADENGTSPYFEKFPDPPTQYLSAPPGRGGKLTAFAVVSNPPIPLARNPFWQAINDLLGVELEITGAPVGDYPNKFQTMVASDDMPDTCLVQPTTTPRLPSLLEARFTDLGEYLSGDAVKDYPSLANIPSHQWAIFSNKVFLVPSPRLALYRSYIVRADQAEAAGVNPQPSNGDELLQLMAALSDPSKNRYASVQALGMVDMVNEMLGTPNNWTVDESGTFTKDYETETFAQALEIVSGMWKSQYLHPDSFSANIKSNIDSLYASGQCPLLPAAASWLGPASTARTQDPTADTRAIALPSWDGSDTPVGRWLGIGTPYHIGIPKTDPERVKEILGVIDALAAPFGTAEHLTVKYGVEGTHWERGDDGAIATTEAWTTDRIGGISYVGAPAQVHFGGHPDLARAEYEQERTDLEHTLSQPQLGLSSETDMTEGTALIAMMTDVMSGVVQGRQSLADWAEAVDEWRTRGGDTIRNEYQEALQSAE